MFSRKTGKTALFIPAVREEESAIRRKSIFIDPNEKKGFMRFMLLLFQEFGELIKLNLMMIAVSIPVLTIPAVCAGGARITCRMMEGENYFLTHEFFAVFKERFLRTLAIGATVFAALLFLGLSLLLYGGLAARGGVFFYLPAALAIVLIFAVLMLCCFLFPLAGLTAFSYKEIFLTSFRLLRENAARALLSAGIFAALLAVSYILDPGSIIFVFFIEFSLTSFINAFLLHPALKAYI